MRELHFRPLGELITLRRGISWDASQEREQPGPGVWPVLGIPNVQRRLLLDRVTLVKVPAGAADPARLASRGTILMVGSNGNPERVGNAVYIDRDDGFLFASFLVGARVRAGSEADPKFIYYFLSSPAAQDALTRSVRGTTGLKNLSQRFVEGLAVPDLPVGEQQRIAEILDTLDDAIRKTEEIIAKLEQVKQGLLHDLLTRGIDDNGELRDPERHPEQFKDSPLGRIPKAWETGQLGPLLEGIEGGWSPACIEQPPPNGAWGVLKVSAVSSGEFRWTESKTLPSSLRPRPDLEVQCGDVILTRANGVAALVGVTAQVEEVPPRLMLSDKLLRLRPGPKLSRDYLAVLMRSFLVRAQIAQLMSGSSGQKNISQAQIRNFTLARPSVQEQDSIVAGLRALQQRLRHEVAWSRTLSRLKQGLMEDLLTGRVRVTPLLDGTAEPSVPDVSAETPASRPATQQSLKF